MAGTQAAHGDHVCVLHLGGVERDAFLLSFLRSGLAAGDRCVCMTDGTNPQRVLDSLGVGLDVRPYLQSGQLVMRAASEAGLTGRRFEAEKMLTLWQSGAVAPLSSGGSHFVRVAREIPAQLRTRVGIETVLAFESGMNSYINSHPELMLLCLYDLGLFPPDTVAEVMRRHPKVLLAGLLLDNSHYLPPEPYGAWRPDRDRYGSGWASLTTQEVRVSRLMASGLTNREIAQRMAVSTHTVDSHAKHIFRKLDLTSRVGLARFVLEHDSPGEGSAQS